MANGVWTVVERVDDGTSEKANDGHVKCSWKKGA